MIKLFRFFQFLYSFIICLNQIILGTGQGCHVSGKCQGKTKFSACQGKVREFKKKKVREFRPFDPCEGITSIKEFCDVMSGNNKFCQDIIFRLKLPSYDKGSTWVFI